VSSQAIAAATSPRITMQDLLKQPSGPQPEQPGGPQPKQRADGGAAAVYLDWRKRPELGYIVNEALKR
jgi:hypothetical protein